MDDRSQKDAEAARRIDAVRQGAGSSLSLAGLGLTTVPPSVGALTGLKELDLSDNQLSSLPDWIGGLTSLESLLLRGNKLVGLPDSVTALRRLTRLDVAMNKLIDIPLGLAVLDQLTYLGLTGNRRLIYPPPHIVARSGEAAAAYTRGLAPDTRRPGRTAVGTSSHPPVQAPAPAPVPALAPAPAGGRGPRNTVGAMTSKRRVLIALAFVVLLGAAAATLALGGSRGSSTALPRSANGYGTADPGASNISAGSAGIRSSGESASPSGPSGAGALSPGASAGQTQPASPEASGPEASGQAGTSQATSSAPPSTLRSNPAAPSVSPSAVPFAPADDDLALGRSATATSYTQNYVAPNAVDGNTGTYWESEDGSNVFPQSLTVNLGSVTTVGRIVLSLPPVPAWNSRTQTLSILGAGSTGGLTTIVGSAPYGFDAGSGGNDDTVTVTFASVHLQYVELVFTANNGWPAAQLSELGVYS